MDPEVYRLLVDTSYDWEELLDPQGNYIYISPSCRRITGYPPEEFTANPALLLEIAHPGDRAALEEHYRSTASGESGACKLEFRILHRDGEERWLEHRCQPVHSNDGSFLGRRGSNRDITGFKRSEEALRQDNAQLRCFMQHIPGLMGVIDRAGKITMIEGALDTMSFDPRLFLGMNAFDAWQDWPQIVDDVHRALQGEKIPFSTFVAVSGTHLAIRYTPIQDEHGQVISMLAIATDITEIKKREKALRQKDALLRNVIVNVPIAIMALDKNGVITLLEGEGLESFGVEAQAAIGQSALEYFSAYPEIVANIRQALAGEEVYDLYRIGRTRVYETRYAPVYDEAGGVDGAIVVGINVTEHTQAREQLRQAKEQLEVILAGITDGVHVWNASGKLIYANQGTAWLKNYLSEGTTAEFDQITEDIEVLDEAGMHIPPEQLPVALARRGVQAQPRLVRLRNRQLNEERWAVLKSNLVFDESGAMQMAVVITQDVTELKNAEAALRESEVLYRTLVETSPDGIILVDLKGHILKANQQFAELFGFSSVEELIASHPQGFDLAIEEERPRVSANIQKAIIEGPTRLSEYVARRKDGSLFPIEISGSIILGMAGAAGTLVGICRDISERKRVQQELHEASERLEQRVRERTAELAEANQNLRLENIERQRAEAESRRHAAHMEALAHVAARVNAQLDLQSVLQAICEEAVRAIPAMPTTIVRLYNEQLDQLDIAAAYGQFSEQKRRVAAIPLSLHNAHISTTNPVNVLPDIRKLPYLPDFDLFIEWQIRSVVSVDLLHHEELIGVLNMVSFEQPYLPTDDELAFLQALAEQATIAIANARLFEQVSAGRQRLQMLSQRLVEIQEAERRRLACELHDEIGSTLTSLNINLDLARRSIKAEQSVLMKAQDQLAQTQEQLKQLMQQVRNLSLDLRPAQLDDLGLLPALLVYFERYTEKTGIQVDFKHSGVDKRFAPEIETTAFRIIQEALTNVARHTGVNAAIARIWANQEFLGLQVEDHGDGFDPQAALIAGVTAGLSGMCERVTSCGGDIEIESKVGQGTTLTVVLPLLRQALQESA
ncbi:MAG: PAS domain S-box protein [Anaerolineales bacterium]|nr:PAS domain S-box protein [Anaerolineales bacterium]